MDEMIAAVAGILIDVRRNTMMYVTFKCSKRRFNLAYWFLDHQELGAAE